MSSASIGLPEVIAGLIVLSLNAYVLLAGADFGGGVWDLLASGSRKEEQRTLIAESIAPIWEANHVWLIIVVVMLFTAFPSAFSTIGIVLHIPLSLLLIGIVFRGSAFVFRSYGSGTPERRRTWGRAFAIASTIAPLLLGAVIGAIASGAVGDAAEQIGRRSFAKVFVAPWTSAFAIIIGIFALVLFAFLAAVYSTVAAPTDHLREDFRKRALIVAFTLFVVAVLTLIASTDLPESASVLQSTWSIPLHLVTGIAALVAIGGLWSRRYRLARVSAAIQVSCIIWGWAFVQFPYMVPTTSAFVDLPRTRSFGVTIRGAAAPRATLDLLLIGLIVGSIVLIPSLVYLYKTFSQRSPLTDQRAHSTE